MPLDDVQTQLNSAVEGVYGAFATHQLRSWTDPCLHCCTTADEEAELHAAPLRDLPFEVVRAYASHAMTTWGDERELLYLLPRILEIVAVQDFDWPDLEVVAGAIQRAHWRTWAIEEQQAVEQYFQAKWQVTVSSREPVHSPDTVVCAVGRVVDDLTPYLSAWLDQRTAVASGHLVNYIIYEYQPVKRRLTNSFWGDRSDQAEQVIDWLRSPPVIERLTDLATSPEDAEFADQAAIALAQVST